MSKNKAAYHCTDCGTLSSKWTGQCLSCQAWNTLVETVIKNNTRAGNMTRHEGYTGMSAEVIPMQSVDSDDYPRVKTAFSEFDRVLGGGLVPGGVTLVGGDPGVGKSTLLLQILTHLAKQQVVLYVSGEESPQQVAMRAERLGLNRDNVFLLAETEVEVIFEVMNQHKPKVVVIDSIQTMYTDTLSGAPGGVGQVRESAALLTQYAKKHQVSILLVGHVTKSGEVAGPRVLEHIVDAVIFMESESGSRYRMLRGIKNRFGAVNELGVFAMTSEGLKEVSNPSGIFLSRPTTQVSGSVVMAIWEGTRPLLVELQALIDQSHGSAPRRVSVGLDPNRLVMLLAVLHRHAGVFTHDQDVFMNVVGGVKVTETSADLACLAAVISSLKNKPIDQDTLVIGEVGLSGEIRPVPNGEQRIQEAIKHGFKRLVIPKANAPKSSKVDICALSHVQELVTVLFQE